MVTVDLRQDATAVRALLEHAVRDYSAKHRAINTAKQHPPVTRIDLVFSLGDSVSTPWVHLHLDTKAGGEPDGDPTHPDFARLGRESWLPAVQAVCNEERVAIVRLDSETLECDATELGKQIGEFLVSVLLDARATGIFAGLPKSERCELGVEDPTTGEFGWPEYDQRGKDNLAEPEAAPDRDGK
jgi:hypothetical protein